METSLLFKPFTFKNLKLTNRIVMAPMTRSFSKHHIPGEDVANYFVEELRGALV